jgi:hypothetical protein
MTNLDITQAQVSDYDQIADFEIPKKNVDGVSQATGETRWQNSNWQEEYGAFLTAPEYQNALLMRAIWDTGKGWTASSKDKFILDNISGWGKDTFDDIIYNANVMSMAAGDSFAQIIKNEKGTLVNLKPLNPGSIAWFVGKDGRIIRYEQMDIKNKKTFKEFKPEEIFHLSYNRMADQVHGISKYQALKSVIKSDEKMEEVVDKVVTRQAIPFIIFKYKTDDETKISAIVEKIRKIREKYDDLHIPDDENLLSWEVVNISPAQLIMEYKADRRNKFYRAFGLPQIVPGGAVGAADSDSRTVYLAFEQLVAHRQRYLELQIWNQLAIKIKFTPPTTMMDLIGNNENKTGAGMVSAASQPSQINPSGEQQ